MKSMILCAMLAAASAACATIGGGAGSSAEDIAYENVLLRKNVIHLQRENAVIKDENLEYRRDAKIKQAEIERHRSELAALKRQHATELAEAHKRYRALQDQLAALEGSLREKLRLSEMLRVQEENRLREEILSAYVQSGKRDEEHRHAEEKMKREFAEREFQLKKELSDHQSRLSTAEREAAEMKTRIAELQRTIKDHREPASGGTPPASDKGK